MSRGVVHPTTKASACPEHSKSVVKIPMRPRVFVQAGEDLFGVFSHFFVRFAPFLCVLLCLNRILVCFSRNKSWL